MPANLIEIAAFATVFLGVWVMYEMGSGEEIPAPKRGSVYPLDQYSPAVKILLDYRNEKGDRHKLRVKIARSFHYPDGRVCLRGYYVPFGTQSRSFRIDRIIAVANLDGEVADKRLFLTEVLRIPSHLLPEEPRAHYPMVPAA